MAKAKAETAEVAVEEKAVKAPKGIAKLEEEGDIALLLKLGDALWCLYSLLFNSYFCGFCLSLCHDAPFVGIVVN